MVKQVIATLIALGIAAALVWLGARYKDLRRRKAADKALRLQHEVEPFYQEYLRHLDALREKHDPKHKWRRYPINEPALPQAYKDDINALTQNYSGVLAVKFGDSVLQK